MPVVQPKPEAARAAPPPVAPIAAEKPEDQGGFAWPWLLAVLAALAVGAAFWWRRRSAESPDAVPQIERPRVTPRAAKPASEGEPRFPAHPAVPQPSPAEAEPLHMSLETRRVSITLFTGTLAYRVTIANAGAEPLKAIAISGDMVSAHASLPEEELRAGPATSLPELHRLERLDPGEERTVEGEFRLPFEQMRVIRQGSAVLFVPLVRFRVDAQGAQPVIATRAVGLPPQRQGGGMQPFRLDLGPRNYSPLVQRAC